MYQKILIATRSASCSSLIQFLLERKYDVTLVIPRTHDFLQSAFTAILPPENVHILVEEDVSHFNDQDLIIFLEFTAKAVGKVPSVEIQFGQVPEAYGEEPLFWALKDGKQLSYVSIIQHHTSADHITLLLEKSFDIMPGENVGMLSARLSILMVAQVEELLKGIGGGKPINTNDTSRLPSPSEDDLFIKWNEMEALQIEHLADACNPKYGGARTKINGSPIQVFEVSRANVNLPEGQPPSPPGTIVYATAEQGLFVACKGNTFVRLNILSTSEGFFTGQKLASLGTQPGILLG